VCRMSRSNVNVNISNVDLERLVGEALAEYGSDVETTVREVAEDVGKEAVKKLKSTSPTGTGAWKGHYKSGWKTKKDGNKVTVHNKKYQLTHLLENGHDVINKKGEVIGHAGARKHIKPVEEWVQEEYENKLKQKIERGL